MATKFEKNLPLRFDVTRYVNSKRKFFQKQLQLNKYETDPDFLKNLQSNTTVCLIIHTFCKVCECEIVFVLICRTARTISD